LWAHNALTDAARRGARYAALHTQADSATVKNVVVYGNEAGTGNPMLPNLTTAKVLVDYNGFGLNEGTVTVRIDAYQLQLVLPFTGAGITMPSYATTLTAECAGLIPNNV
jgi:hypothetical protein